mmetsp:Transcript_3473/g.11407  ORF Transcript_3473/g.11407 Transcript_3473/m.11407 type:complete len:796 (-) Transcript_3473:1527-3914(-)
MTRIPLGSVVVGLGWTEKEHLLIVHEHGSALLHDMFGHLLHSFLLLNVAHLENRISSVVFWDVGVVALTNSMQLQACDDVTKQEPVVYAMESGLSGLRPATSMAVLPPRFTSSGLLEVMLGTSDCSVVVVDVNGAEDQLLHGRFHAPIVCLAVAPNGRFIACYTASGVLTVMSTSFTTKVLDFDTATMETPTQMQWCGEDSVIMHWRHYILMIGPYGHWIKFPYSVQKFVLPEVDSCRIVTLETCEVLQRVPTYVETIHRIGSTDFAAMLYDAMEAFEDGDPKADENVRSILSHDQITSAIQTILLAATADFNPKQQKRYLRAALYGRAFCTNGEFITASFVATVRKLRVLNHLRKPSLALCLTSVQYDTLGQSYVLWRVLMRRDYAAALGVAEYIGLSQTAVLRHWACARSVSTLSPSANHLPDQTLGAMIHARLTHYGASVDYASIATNADCHGRNLLANLLLEHELLTGEQIKVLVAIGGQLRALKKAAHSLEADMLFFASIGASEHKHTHSESGQVANALPHPPHPAAQHRRLPSDAKQAGLMNMLGRYSCCHPVFQVQLQGANPSHVCQFHFAGNPGVDTAYTEEALSIRQEILHLASDTFSSVRDSQFHQRVTEEQMDLLRLQSEFERRFNVRCFMDMSASETVYNLVALGASQPSDVPALQTEGMKLQRRFKIPEKRYYSLKIRALAASGQIEALRSFAAEKKSPIGYRPFVDACTANGYRPSQCVPFVSRLSLEEKFNYYMQSLLFEQAAEVAVRIKDRSRLEEVRVHCGDKSIQTLCARHMDRLAA